MNTLKTKMILLFLISTCFLEAQVMDINYQDGSQKLIGKGVKSSKPLNQQPGILILPAWKGIDTHAIETAQTLANLGYHTFVADIYGDGNKPSDNKEAASLSGFYKTNYESYHHRISLALAQLIKLGANENQIVVIGYCFGGTGALEAARANLNIRGVVSFHGGLKRTGERPIEDLHAKVLVLHGADDPYVSTEEIQGFKEEMRQTHADWQMIYYADAVHAFTEKTAGNDKSRGAAYHETAAKRSFEHLLVFLKEVL